MVSNLIPELADADTASDDRRAPAKHCVGDARPSIEMEERLDAASNLSWLYVEVGGGASAPHLP
jgi:hypothetical protein